MTRALAAAVGVLLTLSVGSPVFAAPNPSAPASIPANAVELSLMLNPSAKIVEVGLRAFDAAFEAAAESRSEEAAIFEQNPGLKDAVLDAARPVVRKHILADMPALQQRCGRFYAQRFTSAEIDGLIAFYASPTGAKLVEGMYAGADLAKLVERVGEPADDPLTADEVGGFTRSTVSRILRAFSDEDRKALKAFAATPLFAKLLQVVPDFRQLMADIANEPAPEMEAELDTVVARAVEAYFARRTTNQIS